MPIVDLFAGLRAIGSTRGASGGGAITKMVVDVVAPEFKINLNEPELAGAMAIALAEQFRTNIKAGARLDGSPAKPLAASTIVRREYRRLQGERGGQLTPRIKDKQARKDGRKHWRERFKAARAGEFNPGRSPEPISTRAVESGLLLASIAAVPQADGTWRIFFANNRAQVDRSGNSPVGRAFGMTAGDRSQWRKSAAQPGVRKRLEFALGAAINGKSPLAAAKSGGNLIEQLAKSVELTQSIAEQIEE
jgi:hypothetical protein